MTQGGDRALILARRIPRHDVVAGRAYVIHARNGGVGVAVQADGRLGYRLRREKFGDVSLFIEWDWDEGPPHGTAIPLRTLSGLPPEDEDGLLAWLAFQEAENGREVEDAWHEAIWGRSRPNPP